LEFDDVFANWLQIRGHLHMIDEVISSFLGLLGDYPTADQLRKAATVTSLNMLVKRIF
jgi:hypothetical protein